MKRTILLIMGVVCAVLSAQAQQASHPIKGVVLSAKSGEPLPAATVKIKNTTRGTTTDNRGRFNLDHINNSAVLVVSSIGYTTRETSPGGKTALTIRLKPSANQLDETVIRGYGTTTQRLNTGDISTITAKEISEQPVTNVLAALSGRMPGVYVQTQNGLPAGDIKIQIRGRNSVGAGNDPLYIIDGVPYPSSPLNNNRGGIAGAASYISPLNSLNPGDIQSIDFLKDADATAIYGSRGANGVVLITTKKGKSGGTHLNLNIYEGFSKLNQQTRPLNLKEYLKIRKEAFKNDNINPTAITAPDLLVWDTTQYTNWQKYLLGRTDHITNIHAGVSGGSSNTNFLLSGNFRREGSIYPGSFHYTRAGAYFNLNHVSENRNFKTSFTASYISDNNLLPYDNLLRGLFLPPDFPLYDTTGALNWNSSGSYNPMAILRQTNSAKSTNLVSNAIFSYSLLDGLVAKMSIGFNSLSLNELTTIPIASQAPTSYAANYSHFGNISNVSYIVEPQINYTKKISKGNLGILLGGTWQNTINKADYITGTNYSNEGLLETLSGAGSISASNQYSEYKYLSIFGRVNYNWRNKYIINASFRRDGSSRFGPGKRYGNFYAVAAAWLFSNESFIKDNLQFISFGKIRSSYGLTGNDQITNYQYLSTYGSGALYNGIATLKPTRIANPDYSWETTKKLEVAAELGFSNDRILLTASWYRNRSSDELVSYPLPTQTGFSSYQANLPALIRNTGWEFNLNSINITTHDFQWKTSFNISFPHNKLISFPGLESSSYAYSYQVGKDLSVQKGYIFTGVDPKTGIAQFKDVNSDGLLNNDDRAVIGKRSPDFYGGLNNIIIYKGFALSIFFQFAKQQNNTLNMAVSGMTNYLDIVFDRWQSPGDITSIQKPTATPGSPASRTIFNMLFSSATFSNASYIRFKNISLSYQLKPQWSKPAKDRECKIYIEAQNIFTWAANNRYRLDPETTSNSIPPLKTFVIGLQFSF